MRQPVSPVGLFVLAALLIGWLSAIAPAADEAPALSATSDTLGNGAIQYLPPAGDWTLLGKRSDDRSAGYGLEGKGEIVLVTAPQPQTIPDSLAPKLAITFGNAIRAEAKKGTIEIVKEPRVEEDKRFLLRMHDQFKAEGKFVDRLELFRGVGKNLVSVTIKAYSDDPAEAKKVFDVGEQVMLSIRLNRPGAAPSPLEASHPSTEPAPAQENSPDLKPPGPVAAELGPSIVYREPKLRVSPPAGWRAESTGNSSGLIVTWRDPKDTTNLITLTFRPIPADSKDQAGLRDLAIDQIAAGEKPTFHIEGAHASPTKTIADKRFLRKTQTDYDANGTKVRVTFRQLRAGDGVVSITDVALQDSADAVDALADKVATEVRSTGMR